MEEKCRPPDVRDLHGVTDQNTTVDMFEFYPHSHTPGQLKTRKQMNVLKNMRYSW
jgi:hypothetical protein